MRMLSTAFLATALLAGSALPTHADSLLGIVGSSDSGALVTIGSGDAGTSGVVNLGLGGDNVLDANVGNGSIASATVGSGSGGGLGADVSLLNGTATVGVGVGGSDLIGVDIGIGGGGGNGPGVNPGPGPGPGTNPGNNGGRNVIASGGGGGIGGAGNCVGISNNDLQRLIQSTRIDGSWTRASGVNVQRVAVCPDQRNWLTSALPGSSVGQQLRSAIASDALVSASLSRTNYGADRVIAVQRSGSQLTVFVY